MQGFTYTPSEPNYEPIRGPAPAWRPDSPESPLYSPTGWMHGLGRRNPKHNGAWEALPEELQNKILEQLPLLPVRTVCVRRVCKHFAARLQPHFELLQCRDKPRFARYVVHLLVASPDQVTTEVYSAIHSTVCTMMSSRSRGWIPGGGGLGGALSTEIEATAYQLCRAVIESVDAQVRTMPLEAAKRCLRRVRNLLARADELQGASAWSVARKCEEILASVQAKAGLLERAIRVQQ